MTEVYQQTPRFSPVSRSVDLSVERARVQLILVLRVDRDHSDVAAARADDLPIGKLTAIGRGIRRHGSNTDKTRLEDRNGKDERNY